MCWSLLMIVFLFFKSGLWIRINFNPDPDTVPSFYPNPDRDTNQDPQKSLNADSIRICFNTVIHYKIYLSFYFVQIRFRIRISKSVWIRIQIPKRPSLFEEEIIWRKSIDWLKITALLVGKLRDTVWIRPKRKQGIIVYKINQHGAVSGSSYLYLIKLCS
jgi:hypothetical protein